MIRLEARGLERHVRGHARVAVPVRPDPRPEPKQRRSVHRPRAGPPGVASDRPVRPLPRERVERPVDGPPEARDRGEQRLVEDGQLGAHLVERRGRDGPQVGRVPQQGDLLAQAAAEVGVLVGRGEWVVHGIEQPPDAALRDQQGPAAGLGGMGGQDRVDLHPGEQVDDAVAAQGGAQARDRLADGVVDRPTARPAGPRAQGADAVPLLGQVDELEVDRERVADGGEVFEIEGADPGGDADSIPVRLRYDRGVVATRSDHPAADPLHQDEQLRAALLGDDLPEQRPQHPDLATERIAGAREPGARWLGGDRREPGHPGPPGFGPRRARGAGCHRARMPIRGVPVSRSSVTVRLQGHRPGTGPQPSSVTEAPRLRV